MSDIWDCEYYNRCENSSKCLTCGPNQRLLKLPEDKVKQKYLNRKATGYKKTMDSKESWKELEQTSANLLNAVPTFREARRTIRSGALWFAPGDVVDERLLLECKERGTLSARGKKTFSISKDVIDKIIEESKMTGRFPGFVFRYKDEKESYVVQPFEELVELVHMIKSYETELEILKKENEFLRKKNE